ncbi:PrsW family glutamic-type intramembrane protease [Kribbella sp. NPDC050241]|uniref:PrsW family glutamic-type intramembrane protease n=1 Tax=Kribbella sp. NPDC050241 TaxID=3364115 RepID=UPI00379A0313
MADQSLRLPIAAGKRAWIAVLATGALVWVLAAGVTALTGDAILIPTLFLIGSFLVPVTVVTFALARLDDCRLTTNVVLKGFLAAGTIGVVVSAVTEIYLLPTGAGPVGNALGFFGVGAIEEVSKGAVLVAVAWRVPQRTVHGGMVLGATVGAGFAAFESTGYAFWAYIQHTNDHPELSILQTEVSRAMLAPFGHLTWTALLGGALFAAAAPPKGGFRVTRRVIWTFLGVSALHGAWDASYGWGIWITQGVTGNGWIADWPDGTYWEGSPTQREQWVFQGTYDGTLAVVALIGVVWVILSWRHARHAATSAPAAGPPINAPDRQP